MTKILLAEDRAAAAACLSQDLQEGVAAILLDGQPERQAGAHAVEKRRLSR